MELALRRGDLVKIVDYHVAPDGEERYSSPELSAQSAVLRETFIW